MPAKFTSRERSITLTVLELITFAKELEKTDQQHYNAYMKKTDRQGLKNLLASLVSQENEHEKRLEEVLEDPVIEDAFVDAPRDIDVSKYTTEKEFSESMDYNDLLNLVIEKEEKTAELYAFIASVTEYDEIKYFFDNLASEERKHKKWAVDRYELEMLSSF